MATKQPIEISMSPSADGKVSVRGVKDHVTERPTRDLDIDELLKFMKERMDSIQGVVADELHVEIRAPNCVHMAVVDLPGVQLSNERTKEITKRIVRD
ncbi:dynamin family protein [Gregarina niphandrodes]|uniref:Dynamin family protein n=1 Tax=Gregarina niphandrodes TaxID=110365 RepID=A0A023B8Z8_GRENI|nr:dynamin family protein [Gregarina niphandrodes]EZG70702.1 dynamin family protein [Gregarina niphandrodes]|eukprot:XP_011129885.1 dynamin family protein [Gregarina niphandrodes]